MTGAQQRPESGVFKSQAGGRETSGTWLLTSSLAAPPFPASRDTQSWGMCFRKRDEKHHCRLVEVSCRLAWGGKTWLTGGFRGTGCPGLVETSETGEEGASLARRNQKLVTKRGANPPDPKKTVRNGRCLPPGTGRERWIINITLFLEEAVQCDLLITCMSVPQA